MDETGQLSFREILKLRPFTTRKAQRSSSFALFNNWGSQWAKIVVTLERAVNQTDAHHYLQEYSMSLGPSDDPATEQRGVLVIKSKSKTRAKQRKGAVSNWKVRSSRTTTRPAVDRVHIPGPAVSCQCCTVSCSS